MAKTFRNLPKKQADVFEQIAASNDRSHHPATLKALHKKGLIEFTEKCLGRDRFGPIVVRVPYVPILIHMDWCQWCASMGLVKAAAPVVLIKRE